MTLEQRAEFTGRKGNELLLADIATLGEDGTEDAVLGLLAAEHLGRTAAARWRPRCCSTWSSWRST